MNRILGLGAVAVIGALAPVMSVFAADPSAIVDTLTMTVNESCSFTRTTGNGNYERTMVANAYNASFATSTFTSHCNNGKGFKVGAVFTSLAQANGDGQAITYSATTPSGGTGTWTATIDSGATSSNIPATNGYLMQTTKEDTVAGTSATVVYKVSLHDNQAKGTYTGTATYTLVQNP